MPKLKYCINAEYNLNDLTEKESDYIHNRLLKQIEWYDQKSCKCQKFYKRIIIITFSLSSLLPVILLFSGSCESKTDPVKVIAASISSIITILNFILSICMYKELWVKYRSQCERLKSFLHVYLCQVKHSDEEFYKFVSTCENEFVNEFTSWETDNLKDHSSTSS